MHTNLIFKKIVTWDSNLQTKVFVFYVLTMSDEVRMNNINSFKLAPNKWMNSINIIMAKIIDIFQYCENVMHCKYFT